LDCEQLIGPCTHFHCVAGCWGKASFSSTYGAASSAVLPAIWVYYSSQIFFLGAEFTKAYAECYGSAPAQEQTKPTAAPQSPCSRPVIIS
jgi:membrane protein